MFEELKEFIDECYERAKKYVKTYRDVENYRAQAFGALTFAMDNKLVTYEETEGYWNEMWDKFQNLAYR